MIQFDYKLDYKNTLFRTNYRFEWEGEANLPTYLLPYDEDLNND